MPLHLRLPLLAATLIASAAGTSGQSQTMPAAPVPDAAPPGLSAVATLHAQGAQVYECRDGADGHLAWQFREPVATLLEGSRTVGRHYAGPSWELAEDGAKVVGRVIGRVPGGGAEDLPWLRLEVTERAGSGDGGRLAPVTMILRVNTAGGVAGGACAPSGAFRTVAYAADYLFLAPSPGAR